MASERRRVISLDYDGAIAPMGSDSKETVQNNHELIDYINQTRDGRPTKVVPGSNRQDLGTDYTNLSVKENGSCFKPIQDISKATNAEFDGMLMADIYNNKEPGYTLQQIDKYYSSVTEKDHNNLIANYRNENSKLSPSNPVTAEQKQLLSQEWKFDNTKISILYAQMHKAALENPNDIIDFEFFEDTDDIITTLREMFTANPHLIPKNVNLHVHKYINNTFPDPKYNFEIKGTGHINDNYRETVKAMGDFTTDKTLNPYTNREEISVAANLAGFLNQPGLSSTTNMAIISTLPDNKIDDLINYTKKMIAINENKKNDLIKNNYWWSFVSSKASSELDSAKGLDPVINIFKTQLSTLEQELEKRTLFAAAANVELSPTEETPVSTVEPQPPEPENVTVKEETFDSDTSAVTSNTSIEESHPISAADSDEVEYADAAEKLEVSDEVLDEVSDNEYADAAEKLEEDVLEPTAEAKAEVQFNLNSAAEAAREERLNQTTAPINNSSSSDLLDLLHQIKKESEESQEITSIVAKEYEEIVENLEEDAQLHSDDQKYKKSAEGIIHFKKDLNSKLGDLPQETKQEIITNLIAFNTAVSANDINPNELEGKFRIEGAKVFNSMVNMLDQPETIKRLSNPDFNKAYNAAIKECTGIATAPQLMNQEKIDRLSEAVTTISKEQQLTEQKNAEFYKKVAAFVVAAAVISVVVAAFACPPFGAAVLAAASTVAMVTAVPGLIQAGFGGAMGLAAGLIAGATSVLPEGVSLFCLAASTAGVGYGVKQHLNAASDYKAGYQQGLKAVGDVVEKTSSFNQGVTAGRQEASEIKEMKDNLKNKVELIKGAFGELQKERAKLAAKNPPPSVEAEPPAPTL